MGDGRGRGDKRRETGRSREKEKKKRLSTNGEGKITFNCDLQGLRDGKPRRPQANAPGTHSCQAAESHLAADRPMGCRCLGTEAEAGPHDGNWMMGNVSTPPFPFEILLPGIASGEG